MTTFVPRVNNHVVVRVGNELHSGTITAINSGVISARSPRGLGLTWPVVIREDISRGGRNRFIPDDVPVPSHLFEDDFERADAATLGAPWDEHGAVWSVASGQARPSNAGGFKFATRDVGAGKFDVDLTVVIDPNVSSTNDLGLIGRWVDAANHILFNVTPIGGGWACRVFQKTTPTGGGYVGLSSLINPIAVLGGDFNTPFEARMVIQADGGEVFINGVSQTTFTGMDASIYQGLGYGIAAGDSSQLSAFSSIVADEA